MQTIILTDIEGTTSSISFVKDVLFPYARRALPRFVREHARRPGSAPLAGRGALPSIGGIVPTTTILVATLQGWIDEDRKHTALKALQGMIWKDGYDAGDFRAHVYRRCRRVAARAGMRPGSRSTCIPPARCRRRSCCSATATPAT